jgi:hypothetical protein
MTVQRPTTPAPASPSTPFHQPVPIAARILWADDGEAAGMRSPMGSDTARVSTGYSHTNVGLVGPFARAGSTRGKGRPLRPSLQVLADIWWREWWSRVRR